MVLEPLRPTKQPAQDRNDPATSSPAFELIAKLLNESYVGSSENNAQRQIEPEECQARRISGAGYLLIFEIEHPNQNPVLGESRRTSTMHVDLSHQSITLGNGASRFLEINEIIALLKLSDTYAPDLDLDELQPPRKFDLE